MAKEITLIHRAQAGDGGAFAELMRAYHAYVCAIVIGIVKNSHDAEEVVQDTFLSAYRGLAQLEDSAKFKSWLAEIARNRARNWLRKQRDKTVSLDEVSEDILQTQDSPDEQLMRQEQRELIRRIMETLPQKDKEIARAFYLEGASYNELTSTHGLSDKAISFRLSRARRQLSKRLQYLLTGIFIPPGLTLKKIYSGGLTAMKIGTAPKIAVGAAALIALIFIGYIGVRRINAPTVEERVYLSPWEDGTVRPRNNLEGLLADITQDTEIRNNVPQIAAAASTAGTESIDDLFGKSEETDIAQFTTDEEFDLDTVERFTTDTSVSSESTGQSAEDVMYAYLEAWRDFDSKVIYSLLTEQYRRSIRVNSSEGRSINTPDEAPDEVVETRSQMLAEAIRELQKQTSLVSSEYAGDEFHFQLRTPEGISDQGLPMVHCPYQQVKMRKENGVWRIYAVLLDHDSR